MLAHDLLHALVEVRLQFLITLDFAFTHELLYFRICIPLLSVYLVAPDMEVLVGKKLGHFTDELVEELVGFVLGWVHCRIEDSPLAFYLIRTRRTGEFRIPDEPSCTVSGHVELGNHADTPLTRICDQLADFILSVVEPVRAQFVELRKLFAFHAETLIVGQVPMEHVQFHCCHTIKVAFEYTERDEMAAYIDHQSTPGKAGFVLDRDYWHGEAIASGFH